MQSIKNLLSGLGTVFTLSVLTNACITPQQLGWAAPTMQPSHAPTTSEQWTALEEQARSITSGEQVVPPTRLQQQGSSVEHDLQLEANTCYELGLTWGFGLPAYVSVMFQPDADGQLPNDHLAGSREQFKASGETLRYCADRNGSAKLNVAALDTESGALRPVELLEYVVVVSAHVEKPSETKTRRADEAQRASAAQAVINENVKRAEEEKRRAQADALRHCSACQTAYLTCLGNGGGEVSCANNFQNCTGSLDGYLAARTAGPCRRP